MSIRRTFLAFLTVLLVIPTFTAAWADTAADQNIEVSVMEGDVLAISVESDLGLGIAMRGQTSNDRGFDMQITNTYVDRPWQVTVDADDLVGFYWDEPCDDQGCTRYDNSDTISKTRLFLRGGDNPTWQDEFGASLFTPHEGYLGDTTPLLLLEGTGGAFGSFGFDEQPSIRLDAQTGDPIGDFYTTVTYTIEAQP